MSRGRTGMPERHDPGGKVRLALRPGVIGDAEFSVCGRYRLWLSRAWYDPLAPRGYVLWIGMNPSTAEADIDDPTIRKEMHYTKAMGFCGYVKCNVMDYRATSPKALLSAYPRSSQNLPCIVMHARQSERVLRARGEGRRQRVLSNFPSGQGAEASRDR